MTSHRGGHTPNYVAHTLTNYQTAIPRQSLWPISLSLPFSQSVCALIKSNSRLDSGLVLHGLETLLPLVELEGLVDDPRDLDLAAVEIVDGGGELVGLGEGAEDCDFVADWKETKSEFGRKERDLEGNGGGLSVQILLGGQLTRSLFAYTP